MVTPQMVKHLRDKTGAGMADCKKALDESAGDMDVAIDVLRKRGAASAAKRADRSANEGLIMAKVSADGKNGAIVEINCETDFVARNEEFGDFASQVGNAVLNNNPATADDIMTINIGGKTLGDLHNEMLSKFSEKIGIKRFKHISTSGAVVEYIHAGNKLAVLIEVNTPVTDKAKLMIRDIAMQVAAMNPMFIDRDRVNDEAIKKEIEIYRDQAIQEGKKPEIAERVATGKLEKFYQEQCLVEQAFVKDSTKTVKDVLGEVAKEVGSDVKILSFYRYFLGEE
ncbi:MAG: elongation factor Ts [Ignavibacteriae bacterium]|nr:elongation factor Ts [Ignavibacteriota bacterium]